MTIVCVLFVRRGGGELALARSSGVRGVGLTALRDLQVTIKRMQGLTLVLVLTKPDVGDRSGILRYDFYFKRS